MFNLHPWHVLKARYKEQVGWEMGEFTMVFWSCIKDTIDRV